MNRAKRTFDLSEKKRALMDVLLQEEGLESSASQGVTPRENTDVLSLSFAQQRLWFLDQLEPGNFLYNISMTIHLSGRLDLNALEQSLNELTRRHEVLNTTFVALDGDPVQLIAPPAPLPLPIIDLSSLDESERTREVQRLALEEAQRPFDLANGPLLRTMLLRLQDATHTLEGSEEYVLLLSMHHIVSDAWSMGVIFRELSTLYTAFVAGRPSPLPELPIQYADYAIWQRKWLQGEQLERQVAYWKEQLKEAPTVLELPTDYPRPLKQTFRGSEHSFTLSQNLTRAIKMLSRREGTTLFMTLLAAFQILLARYSGQEDIVVGTPIANRTRAELEGLIGYFVNSLVLRLNLADIICPPDRVPTVRQVLARVREVALGAYAHQDLPFEKLVEELQPERSLSHSPLYQVIFAMQNAPREKLELAGLSLQLAPVELAVAKADIGLSMVETEQGLGGSLGYSTDLFEASTIARMVQHYIRLLEAMAADPGQHVTDLPLLTEGEQHTLLVEWNQTSRPYPGEASLQSLFEEQVARSPEAVAVVTDDGTGEQLSYAQLNTRANQLAHYLRSLGVGPETLVGLCLERSANVLVGLLGILKAGGAYLPLDPSYPAERLAYMLSEAQVAVVVTASAPLAASGLDTTGSRAVCLDRDWPSIAKSSRHNPPCRVQGEQLAYVIYTSGSTGRPKGVAVSQRAIVNRLLWSQEVCPVQPGDRVLHIASISFDIALWELLGPLVAGAQVLLARPGGQQDISYLAEVLVRQRVSVAHFVPSLLRLLLEDPRFSQASQLRLVFCGGEAWFSGLAQQFVRLLPATQLVQFYGPTEAAINATAWLCPVAQVPAVAPIGHHLALPVSQTGCTRGATTFLTSAQVAEVAPIGRPIANMQVYLLDAQVQPVPIGVAGELYLGGVGLARGYLHRPELSAERFVPHPYSRTRGARLYRTGDLGRYLPTGEIEYLGRIDQQVKLRGFRIELGEIEAVLAQHGAVRETVVVAREEREGDKRLVAYVVLEQGAAVPSPSQLRAHVQGKLPDYMLPAAFVRLEQLPRTPNGKVDRRALPAPEESRRELGQTYEAPRTPSEDLLVAIWAQVLKREQGGSPQGGKRQSSIGITDNFFELGGHSLLATQVVARIREAFQVDLPLRSLFEAPTIAALAQRLDAAGQQTLASAGPIERVPRTDRVPLSFAQQRLWFLDQLEPGNYFYNIPAALRITGRLDIGVLERSLNELVRRHESLRTTFAAADGEARQVIAPAGPLALPMIDLTSLPEMEREQEAERITFEEAKRAFDLAKGPLLRTTLLRLTGGRNELRALPTMETGGRNELRALPTMETGGRNELGSRPARETGGRNELRPLPTMETGGVHEEEHLLLLTMHHIISDGWSAGVFFHELNALYAAFAAGGPSPLPELPIQYADYAVWQRRWLQGEVLEREVTYWKEQLKEAPSLLELPTDYPRPPAQTFRGKKHSFMLSQDLTQALKVMSRQEGMTLFMTLLAAFQILLARYTGQEDIVVGSPIANRTRAELEELIGFFVNTLVFRTDLSDNPTVQQVLRRVREVALGAYAHQDLPFEKLVEELAPERDLSRNPLFQVIFALQNTPQERLELGGLSLQQVRVELDVTKSDIEFIMVETEHGLEGALGYSTDLFEADTIARMASHFTCLLEGMVADPEQRIYDLPLLAEAERNKILYEWNDTGTEYARELSIHQLFEAQVERTPEALAVVSDKQQLTYQELNERANQLAHHLKSLGVGPGKLVAVYMQRSIEMVVALHGILKAAGAYIPLEISFPSARVHWILSSLGVQHIVTLSSQLQAIQNLEGLPELRHVICLDKPQQPGTQGETGDKQIWTRLHLDQHAKENLPLQTCPDDLAYIIFTSGSTGTPKGVMVRHQSAINLIQWVNKTFKVGASDRVLFVTSLCFDLSVYDNFGMLVSGGSIRVASDNDLQDPERLLRILCDEPITFWNSAPAMLLQLAPFFPSVNTENRGQKLRLVFLSGDWIPVKFPDIIRATFPGVEIINLGGATESTVWSNYFSIEKVDPLWVTMPYGKPIQNARYYILDTQLNPCPVGVAGDMYIGGECLSSGYANEPVLTAEKYIPDPFSAVPGSRLYKTGDRGRYWRDGTMDFLGRKDHQVKIRGFRIELGEIETILEQHPLVREAVVLAREDTPDDKRLVAYVVPKSNITQAQLASANLREYLQAKLPDYMLPNTFMLLDRLPLNSNGKVDRRALPAPDQSRPDLPDSYVAPRSSDEEMLAAIWTQVLKVERVGIYDNFFELGGHSLLATQVIARISEVFQIDLPLRKLFEASTVAKLAEVLVRQRAEEVEPETLAQLLDELEQLS